MGKHSRCIVAVHARSFDLHPLTFDRRAHYAEKDYAHAAHQALIAHGRMQQAIHHGNEATKHRVEQRAMNLRNQRATLCRFSQSRRSEDPP